MTGRPIDFYFVCLSPWSLLGIDLLQEVAARHGRSVAFKPVNVARSWQETGAGRPIGERPKVLLDYRLVEIARWAKYRAMPLNVHPKHFPVPYTASSHLVIAARRAGADPYPLTRAIMRALWIEERDIADPTELARIADGLALDGAALVAAIDSQPVIDELEANTDEMIAAGGWSVPTYVVDGETFYGQDRLEMIDWRLSGI
jgi:2-hydroxychromene-2-carboxylate isomerase